jgi:hypothetical protein
MNGAAQWLGWLGAFMAEFKLRPLVLRLIQPTIRYNLSSLDFNSESDGTTVTNYTVMTTQDSK